MDNHDDYREGSDGTPFQVTDEVRKEVREAVKNLARPLKDTVDDRSSVVAVGIPADPTQRTR